MRCHAQTDYCQREKLAKQIISPVRRVACVEFMIANGVCRFIEFGPQKVLLHDQNIDKDVEVFSIDK
jgi:malonyl CoA-acyl carrier protein transacylase